MLAVKQDQFFFIERFFIERPSDSRSRQRWDPPTGG
jgi:hypothetical protein